MTLHCLFYAGSNDDQHDFMKHFAKDLSNSAFVSFLGFDHFQIVPRSDLVAPHIIMFLAG